MSRERAPGLHFYGVLCALLKHRYLSSFARVCGDLNRPLDRESAFWVCPESHEASQNTCFRAPRAAWLLFGGARVLQKHRKIHASVILGPCVFSLVAPEGYNVSQKCGLGANVTAGLFFRGAFFFVFKIIVFCVIIIQLN